MTNRKLKTEQFSVSTAPYLHQTLIYALDSIAGNGFKQVEIWAASPHYCVNDFANPEARIAKLREIRKQVEDRGMQVSALYPEQHRQYPYNIASPNDYLRDWSIRDMKISLEDALELGTNRMILCPGWEYLDKQSEDNRKRSVEAIASIAEEAKRLGVSLFMEEMATIHSTFTDNMSKLKGIIEDSGNYVKPCFENVCAQNNQEQLEDYEAAFDKIEYMHLSDQNQDGYAAFGWGYAGIANILSHLADEEYEGIISVSLWGGGYYKDPDTELRKTADFLRCCKAVDGRF